MPMWLAITTHSIPTRMIVALDISTCTAHRQHEMRYRKLGPSPAILFQANCSQLSLPLVRSSLNPLGDQLWSNDFDELKACSSKGLLDKVDKVV